MPRCQIMYDYNAPPGSGQLTVAAGDVLEVVDSSNAEWFYVNKNGSAGHVPANYCNVLPETSSTPARQPTRAAASPGLAPRDTSDKQAAGKRAYLEQCQRKGFDPSTLTASARKRQEAIRQFMANEDTYVQTLETMIDGYLNPMRAATKEIKISKEDAEHIFQNVEQLHNFASKRMMECEQKVAGSCEAAGEGFILNSMVDELSDAYIHYYDKFPSALATLNAIRANDVKKNKGKLKAWMRERPGHGPDPLVDFLRAPLNRIPAYVEEIDAILANTESDSSDHGYLSQALQTLRKVQSEAAEELRWKENFKRLKEIEANVIGIPKEFANPKKKGQDTRWFLKEGVLMKHAKGQKAAQRYFFLFSNMLMWTEPKKGKYRMCKFAPLMEVSVQELPDSSEYRGAFKLTHHPKKEYILIAPNADEKQSWLSTVTSAVEAMTGAPGGTAAVAPAPSARQAPAQQPRRTETKKSKKASAPSNQKGGKMPVKKKVEQPTQTTATVMFDFPGAEDNEIPMKVGEIVVVEDMKHPDWWTGFIDKDGWEMRGMFPSAYVQLDGDAVAPATPAPEQEEPYYEPEPEYFAPEPVKAPPQKKAAPPGPPPPAKKAAPPGPPAKKAAPPGPPAKKAAPPGPPAKKVAPPGPPAKKVAPPGPPAKKAAPPGPPVKKAAPPGPPAAKKAPPPAKKAPPPAKKAPPPAAKKAAPPGPPAKKKAPPPAAKKAPPPGPPKSAPPPPAKTETMFALFDYDATRDDELTFNYGDEITIFDKTSPAWYKGTRVCDGKAGVFPGSYVGSDPPPAVEEQPTGGGPPGDTCYAIYPYVGQRDDELSFEANAEIIVTDYPEQEWYKGYLSSDPTFFEGAFPASYVEFE